MKLPIVAFGDPILKRVAQDISKEYPDVENLIANMFETMNNSHGVGLAAPQVGLSIRLFIVDTSAFKDEYPDSNDFRQVFINPKITDQSGVKWTFNEGCLSIPGIREDIVRFPDLTITYFDENWKLREEKFTGIIARVIQHEYDHIEGKLFIDHLSSLKKALIKGKLIDISKGKVDVEYKMKFYKK